MKSSSNLRFLLIQVIPPQLPNDAELQEMKELELLVGTLGGVVVEKSTQHRAKPNPDMYIGKGKVEWLKETVKQLEIDVIVLNDLVNSGQLFRLEKTFWEIDPHIKVWDRIDLILHIFDQHATSTEAKLQIELARIQHLGPRVYGLGKTVLSRQGAGIGTRGLGETNIEMEKRISKKRQQKIKTQLKQAAAERQKLIDRRKRSGVKTVALVGYTSAGKTTLFNTMTLKGKKSNKSLFTTLDSVVGRLKPDDPQQTLLVSDTIGFIENLPPFLIEAFKSTLQETVEAEVLLHVIDLADPQREKKIQVVEDVLKELGVQQQPLRIFNKIDVLSATELEKYQAEYASETSFFISAKTGAGVEELKEAVANRVENKHSYV